MKNGKMAFVLLGLLIVAMAGATIFERTQGTEQTLNWFYHSPWMLVLWLWLALTGLYFVFERKLYKKGSVFLLHLSLIVMLLGAAVSHFTSFSGTLAIRKGEVANLFYSPERQGMVHMPFAVKLLEFTLETYPSGNPADYLSRVEIIDSEGSAIQTISMNKILKKEGYRLYQSDYDRDGQGTVLSVYHDPSGIALTYMGYLLMFLSMFWILLQRRNKVLWVVLGVWLLALSGLLISKHLNPKEVLPVLNTPLLSIHVSFFIIAYSIGGLLFLNSIASLISLAIRKKETHFFVSTRRWSDYLLVPATFFMAIGIFVGAVWANISWGNYWGWDPKEVWALVTFLLMSIPLHRKTLPIFRQPIVYHGYIVLIFAFMMMTYFGVNHLLGGMHSYG